VGFKFDGEMGARGSRGACRSSCTKYPASKVSPWIVASGIAMQFGAKPLFSDVSHRLAQERSLLDGQHPIAIQLRGEPRVLQSFRYFVGNVPAAGQFVRCAGVVE